MNWRRSSRSNGNGGNNCVEVGITDDGRIAVRDSKSNGRKHQAFLIFTPAEWRAFLSGVRLGEFEEEVLVNPQISLPVINVSPLVKSEEWPESARQVLMESREWKR